ncbi:histidine kinase [Mucilaginibacter gynuensis]|uniref:Histidine kinase n=1 Tax=Mucilaginibacter gynuensis TaxID=1302236 RepID=A0ABP8G3G9_9SPHI
MIIEEIKTVNKNVPAGAAKPTGGFFVSKLYFFGGVLAGIPVYVAIAPYIRSMDIRKDEIVSLSCTIAFIMGVFTGRYMSQMWASKLRTVPVYVLAALAFLVFACMAWLFFHADFPLHGRPAINLMMFALPLVVVGITFGAIIKIAHSVTSNQLVAAQQEADHSKSELYLLQSQLSPHFLFNTLNNLYGLSITSHQRIPPLLLKLSELLRYSVYDAGEIYVPLKSELAYINNYIEFEKIRIGDRLQLTTDIEDIADVEIRIAPMLLIVFIENAFKHSKNTASPEVFVDIKLKIWANSILFSVKNSFGTEEQQESVLPQSNGFGLANARKRLELLYPNAYELNINDNGNFYTIDLQLKIKK